MISITQKIHRVIGLIGVLFILMLTITGVMLNHSEDLELYESYPTNGLVLWLYGSGDKTSIDSREDWGGGPPSWEKVLTAFHGGKFFGLDGNIFLDFLAVIIFTITLTGPYLWYLKRRNSLLYLQTGKSIGEEGELLDLLASIKDIQALHAKTTALRESLKSALDKDKEKRSPEMIEELDKLDIKLVKIHSNLDRLIERIGSL